MQAENRRKLHSPGPDRPHGQGAHPMCHSCGWTFPNPHPSAKHRRAHRKHCGKIEGFPLASPRDEGGSNGNDPGDDDADAALVTPAAAAAPPGGKLSDAHSHPHTGPMCSLDALDRPAMEEGNADSMCGTGEEGTEIFESVGFHGHEALIGIHPGNSKDSSEATSVPGDDKDLKLPDLLHDKEIQRVDAVNVVVQSENGNQLQGPTAYAYTSDMKRDRLSSLHCPVNKMCSEMDQCPMNKMCSEMDQCVLDEFSVEMKAVREEMSGEGSKLYLESPPIKLTESNDSMDAEPKSLKMSNFVEIDVLSNLTITSAMETGVPGTAVAMNLKEVTSELFHVQEMGNNEVGESELANAPTLMKVDTADCQGTSLDPGKAGKQSNVFDNNVKEKEGDYALSACQIPQDAYEDNISDINHEAWLCHEQVASPLPANHESVLKPEDSLGDPDFRHVQSESMLTESRKENTLRIHHKVCNYQRQAAPDILPETIIAEAESVPDCNIDPRLIEMQSESAPVEASEICSGFISSEWPCWNNLVLKSKGNENIANKSDENENKTDGINEVKYQIVKKGESDLSIENIQGTEGSSEQMAFPVAMKDQSLNNLIRVVQGPVTSSDHVEGNVECSSGNKVSFPDLACQSTPECVTVEDSGTFGSSNLFTEAIEGKVESCIAVTSTSENNQDDARFHHDACMETMNPASEADISDVKSPQYHDLGDNKMQRNKEITESHRESLAVTDGDSQPCIHGFIHLDAWIDHSVCEDSNQKEVECGESVVQIETEPRSYITEEKHWSDVELHKNELSKESVLTHMSPALCLSKFIIDDTSSNMESMSSMSNLNLHQESSQNAVHESSAESAGDVDFDIAAAETCIQNKLNETHDTVSEKPDQEGKLNQNSEAQLSYQSMEIPAAEDMVLPPDMLLGIQSSDIEPLNISGEVTSSICFKSDEQADVEIDKDDGRYSPQVLNETVTPESASYIFVKSLHYQDLEENKLHTEDESTESVAVSRESSRPCPPIGMGSENPGSIPLEAWIDYSTCADSNQTELEGSQLTMHIETEPRSYVTEEQHPDVGLGKNELDKQPQLAHLSSISDTSRSIIDDSFSNLKSRSRMSNLTFDQTISQNEINKSSRESAGDGDHDCVVRETHFQIKPSDTDTTVFEKTDDEKKLIQNNGELLSQHSVEMPTEENMISSPDMLSGIQSSISLEETNRNGKVACSSICHQPDKHADHLTLNQEDPAAPSAQDALMDTMSQTDSIEVHWGSVSVLSASEAIDSLQDFDTEAPQGVNTRRYGGLHETSLMKRAVSGEKCTEIADLLDAPFPLDDGSQVPVEVGSLQGTQQSSSCTANGVSPSHRDAVCESKARMKKEEIIAKIENWSSGKQHVPLKTLLVEANNESRQKTSRAPLHKSPPKSTISRAPQDEGFTGGTPAPISEHLADISARKEAQKEWNSPARLPSNRNDKRKVKGKPQWVPFLCCPSLH